MNAIAGELRATQARNVDARRADSCARTRDQRHCEQAASHAQSAFEAALRKVKGNTPDSSHDQHRAKEAPGDAAKAQTIATFAPEVRPWSPTDPVGERSASDECIHPALSTSPPDLRPIALPTASTCPHEAAEETEAEDRLHVDLGDRSVPVRRISLVRRPGMPLQIELHARSPSTAAILERSMQTLHQRLSSRDAELTVVRTAIDTGESPSPHFPSHT